MVVAVLREASPDGGGGGSGCGDARGGHDN
jgi:hypothetical protein